MSKKRHIDLFDPDCPICSHPLKENLEDRYVRWYTFEQIHDLFATETIEFTQEDLEIHARATKINQQRAANTYDAWAVVMELGMEKMRKNKDWITARLFQESMMHIDKREGRIIERHKDEGPRTVVFLPIPPPGGTSATLVEGKVIEEKLVELGPPKIEAPKEEK